MHMYASGTAERDVMPVELRFLHYLRAWLDGPGWISSEQSLAYSQASATHTPGESFEEVVSTGSEVLGLGRVVYRVDSATSRIVSVRAYDSAGGLLRTVTFSDHASVAGGGERPMTTVVREFDPLSGLETSKMEMTISAVEGTSSELRSIELPAAQEWMIHF